MKLKRFIAADTRAAMQQIKAAFGPDAVILSSSQVDGGVEVVAAIDFDESMMSEKAAIAEAPKAQVEVRAPELDKKSADERVKKPAKYGPTDVFDAEPIHAIRQEILTLRDMIETQIRQGSSREEPLHQVLIQKLLALGMSTTSAEHFAHRVPSGANQYDAWEQIKEDIQVALPLYDKNRIEEGGIYAFVGPTGVGKTTSLAKIAARFVLRFGADKLGLITMDTYRIAAQEQLLVYGKILGVKVCVAQDELSLSRTIKQLSDKKLILIDTPGLNPADERVIGQMEMLSSHLHSIQNVLVLPATSHHTVLIDALLKYKRFGVMQSVITKLDEAQAIGAVLSALIESQVGVGYLTHGQRVPEDIKLATRHQLMEAFAVQESRYQSQRDKGSKGHKEVRRVYVDE